MAAGAFVVVVAVQLSVLGLYLPPVFTKRRAGVSAPDDHWSSRSVPHRRMPVSASGRVGSGGGCPTVGAGIVSAAGVHTAAPSTPPHTIISLPVQTARVKPIGHRARWSCWWLSNYPCWDCISRRCSNSPLSVRPRRSFRCRSRLPCARYRAAGALVVLVAVQLSVLGLYLPPVFKRVLPSFRPRRSFHCQSTLPCACIGAAGALVSVVGVHVSSVQPPEGPAITGSV